MINILTAASGSTRGLDVRAKSGAVIPGVRSDCRLLCIVILAIRDVSGLSVFVWARIYLLAGIDRTSAGASLQSMAPMQQLYALAGQFPLFNVLQLPPSTNGAPPDASSAAGCDSGSSSIRDAARRGLETPDKNRADGAHGTAAIKLDGPFLSEHKTCCKAREDAVFAGNLFDALQKTAPQLRLFQRFRVLFFSCCCRKYFAASSAVRFSLACT